MKYKKTLDFLFSQLPMYQRIGKAAYKADLNNTLSLDKYFDYPHKKFKSIHVAGTNGKGSVSHCLAAILQTAGYKVGLYTSPHLKDFRERIKINGNKISKKNVVDFVENNKDIIEKIKPSFFEITVAMAFDYFANENVDIAVIEVGMGGRLDSTNIISPIASIITNISLDHTQFLGDTIEKIAYEKAGIIKQNIPVVIGETQELTKPVFIKKANDVNTKIYFADNKYSVDYSMQSTDNKQIINVLKNNELIYKNLKIDLLGLYQKKNLITVLQAVDIIKEKGINIETENIYDGLKNASTITGLLGRWQILGNNPLIVCDTGHNVDGIKNVVAQIKNTAYKKLHFVIGFVNDKNIDKVLSLLPKDATYYFTRASIPRALDENILTEKALANELHGTTYHTVEDALNAAKNNSDKDDLIFIGGSNFVVAEVV
ncbi:MAG: bifunctional folylpolyglutamate synthase/dihydrofolate synthase [Bacteroidetes bacterium]|nr:MAG: bifunctional folylpolyglutamate synthase/dihydrofolate synthase [Bacteroidota bacterium]